MTQDKKKNTWLSDFGLKLEPATPVPQCPYDFENPSKAVIANVGGDGVVLWYVGGHLDYEINEAGMGVDLCNLGLDDAPEGLSVWEGKYIGHKHETMDGTEYETECVGEFRDPTEDEWELIRQNVCPWGDDE